VGFMDKAKKLAEQAQEKLDEAQKQFNSGGQTSGQQADAGVRYDEHGRPEAPPAGQAAPPSGQPPADAPAKEAEKPAPQGGADANPDPFKPIQ
jgi:hypothetical protein